MAIKFLVAAFLTAVTCSLAWTAAPAQADDAAIVEPPNPITVVASGLFAPYQLSTRHGRLYVDESMKGQITEVDKVTGELTPVITGLGDYGLSVGAAPVGDKFAILTGESEPGPLPESSVLIASPGGPITQLADLLAYELAHNPDGQTQYSPDGTAPDSVSNPYYVLADRHRRGSMFVVDEAANDVLRVNAQGQVSTFFVLPTVNTGACKGLANNDAQHPGCDGMPTGLAYGPGNTLYVTARSGRVKGEGRIYVLNATTGRVKRVITGLDGPTGVAVDRRTGTVYVSELLAGLWPSGEGPPQGFDPSTIGQIVKIPRHGRRTYAQVTMPSGLLFTRGKLYASAWTIGASFYKRGDLGQVVTVGRSAFVAAPSR